MTIFEVFDLPRSKGKQVYQITTNQRIFFILFSKGEKIEETALEKYLQKGETLVSIKKAIDVIVPV